MSDPSGAGRARAGSRAPERLLRVLGVLLLVAGLLTIVLRRLQEEDPRHAGVSGQVLAELETAERIDAEAGALRDFNVLVITTDTTRADHLATYGNQSVETPTFDALAREGVLFANAITPSPSTLPAHSSLMTGLYPINHGARANGTFRLEDHVTTLAERLGDSGYRTGAVVSAFVLDSRFGLDQGFDAYHDDLTKGFKLSPHSFRERSAELTNEPAVAWLREKADGPFFLWVHYFDPHAAYLPPEPFRKDYAADLYDGEIAYVDSQIGALLSELEELGVRERTLVVYTSDHGEGLGEHGEQTHSLLTYDGTLHVPLIFHAPAQLPRGVVDRQAAVVDVVPTVLSLLGQEVPDDLDGNDLTRATGPEPRSIYFESIAPMTLHGWSPLMGVRRDDYKYILAPTPELYDLRSDPEELENLHDAKPEIVEQLREELVEVVGGDPLVAAQVTPNLAMDDETRESLAALGYIQTVKEGGAAPVQRDFDPKEMVHHWEKLQLGLNLRAQGRMREALPILEESVAEVEGDLFARNVLGGAYLQRGDFDKAMELYRRSAEIEPNDEGILLGIANVHFARGELEEAEEMILEAAAVAPESAGPTISLARLALMRRDPGEAMRLFEDAIESDPGSSGPTAYTQIGWIHLRANRLDEARQAFRAAIRIDGLNGAARDGLANLLIAEEKFDEAAEMLATALRFDPNQPRALSTLASLISRGDDQAQALEVVRKALELQPKSAEAHNAIGLIYRRQDDLVLAEEHYRKAIEFGAYLDKPHINLAQLYLRQGKTEEAMEEFREALRKNRASRIALANLGAEHFNEGRVDQAYRFYQRALQVDPNYALVHKNIGSIYALRDRPERAAYHLRRSLELDPGQPQAEEMRYLISEAEKQVASAPSAPADGPPAPQATP